MYKYLRRGNVVIDIDEANVTPEILWVLAPVLRGDTHIFPSFPGEPPFKIGDKVLVVFTMNPDRYAGRHLINRRLTGKMTTLWMDLPTRDEKIKIVKGFYGEFGEAVLPREATPDTDARDIEGEGGERQGEGEVEAADDEIQDFDDEEQRPIAFEGEVKEQLEIGFDNKRRPQPQARDFYLHQKNLLLTEFLARNFIRTHAMRHSMFLIGRRGNL